ncbi:MAG TPA: hypothetical protein VFM70_07165, partial [Salinimicrobium sp.]|nr:hypothetical protein [Salinimicrobium sp.]
MAANSNTSDEIELGALFNAIKSFFKRILILIYRAFRFILKSWLVILVLIIIGAIVGYFLQQENKGKKEAVLIVQTNFNSTSYVYNAVNQINESAFDKENEEFEEIDKIEIKPVIDVSNLFDEFHVDRNAVLLLLENYQEEEGPQSLEAFTPQFRFHEITVVFDHEATEKSIDKLISYLQKNTLLQEMKEVSLKNYEERLVYNREMVQQIDEVMATISESNETGNGLVLMGENGLPLNELLYLKRSLLHENDEITRDILAQQELVVLVNKP